MNTTLPKVDAPKEWEFTYRSQIMRYLASEKCNTTPIAVCDRRSWDPSFDKDTHKILNDLKETSYNIGWMRITLNAKWGTNGEWGMYNKNKGMPEFLSHYKDFSTDAHYVLTREAPVHPGVLTEVLTSKKKFKKISTASKYEVEEMKNNAWAYFLINNIAEDWVWEVEDHSGENTIRWVDENGTFERYGMSVKEIELTLFVLGPLKGKFDMLLNSMFHRYFVRGDDSGQHWLNFWRFWVTQNVHVMKKLDPYLRKNVSKQFIALAQHYIVHEFKKDGN